VAGCWPPRLLHIVSCISARRLAACSFHLLSRRTLLLPLSFAEIRARLVLFCACPQEDRLFHIFSVFDADASGYIDAAELQNLIATVTGLTPSPEEVVAYGSGAVPAQVRLIADDIMRRYDASGDGRLDFAEFRSGAATDPRLGGAFWTVSH